MKVKEFKEIKNPHSNLKKKKEENKFNNQIKIENSNYINEQKQNIVIDYDMDNTDFSDEYLKAEEKRLEMLENKSESPAIKAKKLLEEGLINSYIDFFYIYQRKIPNIAINYQKLSELPLSEFKESEDHSNNLTTIKVKLVLAEKKYMRLKNYPLVINKFLDIRTSILQHQDYNSSVYFNQKAIDIAKSRELMDYLLFSFLFMGDCFQNADDSIIRIQFKENAKQLFEKHGSKNNKLNLDKFLYESLMKLYEELAVQQENTNNYENAIKFLVKQLDNLKSLKMIVKDYNDKSKCEQDEIRIYLKVAELNYKQNKYEDANLYLDIAKDLLSKKSDDQNNLKLKGLFLYAQVFEAQGLYDSAIDKLNLIEQVSQDSGISEDSIYSKAYLNLGRLYYKQGNLEMGYKHLNKFFKESRKNNENKDLLDLARVNLGMIKGTQGLGDLIKLSKNCSYQDFLKMKLKYFNDT